MDDKLIAKFMGLIYIPWNDLQGYSCPGWWKTNYYPKILPLTTKNHRSKINGFVCRNIRGYYRWDWNKLMQQEKKYC